MVLEVLPRLRSHSVKYFVFGAASIVAFFMILSIFVFSLMADDKCKDVKCSKPYERCYVVKDQATCSCPLAVSLIYAPVCGTDDKTYASEGAMKAQACQQNKMIAVKKVGQCGKFAF